MAVPGEGGVEISGILEHFPADLTLGARTSPSIGARKKLETKMQP